MYATGVLDTVGTWGSISCEMARYVGLRTIVHISEAVKSVDHE